MEENQNLVDQIKQLVLLELKEKGIVVKKEIPVSISARHIHVSKRDLEILFGKDYELTRFKDLSQPGQFACNEKVTIQTDKGEIKNLRILGPVRTDTQIELSLADHRKLGLRPMIRESGDLDGTPGVTVIGPNGKVRITKGVIVALRHIHMTPQDASQYDVENGQFVSLKIIGERAGIMSRVKVRVSTTSKLDCHIDTDEANGYLLSNGMKLELITQEV